MVSRHRVMAVSAALCFLFSAALVAQRGGQGRGGQQPAPDARAQAAAKAAENAEIQATVKLADDLAAGLTAPNDFALAWMREDFMKGGPNSQYVPFIVTVDASKFTGGPVAVYWRVVSKAPPAAPATPPPAGAPPARPRYAYEDINVGAQIDVASGGASTRIARSFSVPAGSYDVYVAIKEPVSAQRGAPPPKAAVLKHTITVPDFWTGDLTTSSVLIGPLQPLTAPLTPQQAVERPYALGPIEIIPVADTKFTKRSALSLFMLIYNAKADAGNKPDVSVEYIFCQAAAGTEAKEGDLCKAGEKFFNKTNPQNLNAQSLPPEFNLAAGHQVQTGQEIPLASFPEGSYRLEVKVTDKLAMKTLTRDVNFSVAP